MTPHIHSSRPFFPDVAKPIAYEGPDSRNPLAFKHYDPEEKVLGKPLRDHLRFAVCYWHGFKNLGTDVFGGPTMIREYTAGASPLEAAERTMHAAFEFFTKLGVSFWCFHDRDIGPEGEDLAETNRNLDRMAELAKSLQQETGVHLLWGTANLFGHRRYLAGAGTNPSPGVFAYAGAQVKKALEITHELGGAGYTFWGGREGYDTLLNTDLAREAETFAAFLRMAVEHKRAIGFGGQFYIEPKPQEPTKHQYDFDAQSTHAFLLKYDLVDHFKLNVEANHATLAGHSFQHELEYAAANDLLGSVDANRGDLLCGWDTDQFPTDLYDTTLAMYTITRAGGFKTGGLNFDAKLRRQSIDPSDLFHAHIGAMDAFARGMKTAARLIEEGTLERFRTERYAGWDSELGRRILQGRASLADMEAYTLEHGEPPVRSGRQEYLENVLNEALR